MGQEVTRDGWIRENGHQRWGEPSPYGEADRSRYLHQREPIEQGKEVRFLTPEAERIGWLLVIALNTWLTGLDQYSHTWWYHSLESRTGYTSMLSIPMSSGQSPSYVYLIIRSQATFISLLFVVHKDHESADSLGMHPRKYCRSKLLGISMHKLSPAI
jgi:hypothetical protein